jgi:16S rRNA (adenine1518-N6/adenine1519-N6)-dimethyltransferase
VTLSHRQVVELLHEHGLEPSRALGQNFVADANTVRRIARLAELAPGDRVVEIGPGLGSLTLALVEVGARVTCVEKDRHLLPVLRSMVEHLGVRVLEGDALDLDWVAELAAAPDGSEGADAPDGSGGGAAPWALVANLPYNVATPLVLEVLDHVPVVDRMLVMVQREVGERLAAAPGSREYGIPSVKVAYHGTARVVGRVPAAVFVPRPRVESVLVRIERRPAPATDADPEELFGLVREAFGQRRKMLRRSLGHRVPAEAFEAAGVGPEDRPERLSVQDFGRLALALTSKLPRAGDDPPEPHPTETAG